MEREEERASADAVNGSSGKEPSADGGYEEKTTPADIAAEPDDQADDDTGYEDTAQDGAEADSPAEDMPVTDAHPASADKKKKKRILIIVLAAVTVLAGLSWLMTYHSDWVTNLFRQKKSKIGSNYSDELRNYNFYKTDYNLDPTKDEEYMGLDRQLWYHDGPLGRGGALDDGEYWLGYNNAVIFFTEYFRTVIAGDTNTYNTFFTDRYIRDNGEHVRFAPQMLYDIHIYQLSESTSSDGVSTWTFRVEYKIRRNDGTFRNDIPSDGSRPLYFDLIGDASGNVLIDSISRNRSSS